MHMADMVNMGVALDHQGHVRFRVAQFGQLHLSHIVGRDLQHATKAAKPILNGRGLCIASVFFGKARVCRANRQGKDRLHSGEVNVSCKPTVAGTV